ncbi:MAG: cytidylate kinase-like family protein [Lachnospiraceae bacterium]|nr:cytidylate kinase-like family protein [Lachnospiraceae bacterium]MDD3615430.1 cytidylate kinase-like family protein [Lachnospiraceae bacterium]
MKKKYVITIARQFGSLGRTIGKKVAENLGIAYYDRELLEDAVEILGKDMNNLDQYDEKLSNPFFKALYPMGLKESITQTKLFELQKAKILEISEKESCVIVGRCADYILKNHKNVLKLFIYAPYKDRIYNCTHDLNLYIEDAKKMITSVDKARQNYHEFYTGESYDSIGTHDLMINSSLLGVEKTAELIEAVVKSKFC